MDGLRCSTFVPLPFVDTDDFAALDAKAILTEEVGRVGKYEVELEVELGKKFQAVAMKQGESSVGGAVVWDEHRLNFNSRNT